MNFISEEENLEPNLFNSLRGFIRGKLNARDLESVDSSIYKIRNVEENKAQSKIIFDLGTDDEFFKIMGLEDTDDGWFARWVSSSSSNIDIENFDSLWDDWKNGYGSITHAMSPENLEKLLEITFYLTGKKIEELSEENLSLIAQTLSDFFDRESTDLVYEYKDYLNEEIRITAEESIMEELSSFLEDIGFEFYNRFDMIETTPANLLMWFSMLNTPDSDFKELFTDIINKVNPNNKKHLGGWFENQYEFRDTDNFDSVGYNNQVSRILDKISEKIEDNPKYREAAEKIKKLSSKFNFNQEYEFKTDPSIKFRIENYDFDNDKLQIRAHTKKNAQTIKLSINNFLNLYYQPTLFDLRKILNL